MNDISFLKGESCLFAGDVFVFRGVVVEQGPESNPRLADLLLAFVGDKLERDGGLGRLLEVKVMFCLTVLGAIPDTYSVN